MRRKSDFARVNNRHFRKIRNLDSYRSVVCIYIYILSVTQISRLSGAKECYATSHGQTRFLYLDHQDRTELDTRETYRATRICAHSCAKMRLSGSSVYTTAHLALGIPRYTNEFFCISSAFPLSLSLSVSRPAAYEPRDCGKSRSSR